jgi:hypothetical protein
VIGIVGRRPTALQEQRFVVVVVVAVAASIVFVFAVRHLIRSIIVALVHSLPPQSEGLFVEDHVGSSLGVGTGTGVGTGASFYVVVVVDDPERPRLELVAAHRWFAAAAGSGDEFPNHRDKGSNHGCRQGLVGSHHTLGIDNHSERLGSGVGDRLGVSDRASFFGRCRRRRRFVVFVRRAAAAAGKPRSFLALAGRSGTCCCCCCCCCCCWKHTTG